MSEAPEWAILLEAERDQLKADKARLVGALKPFALFACELELDETCDCHNCVAKQALKAAGEEV